MVKVQNGWQARSLDEVESLASQSPRSAISGFQHFSESQMLSPKTTMSRKLARESSESDSSESTAGATGRGRLNILASSQDPSRRALAPPLDIIPGSRRRPAPNAALPRINGPYIQSRPMHSARPHVNQRTPSQNAAMEADAVETLLFMASPNNSGYNPPSLSAQTSPLRTQFSQTSVTSPKRVAFSPISPTAPAFDKEALIDRMLDDLSDDSDGELEQAFRHAEKPKLPDQSTHDMVISAS
jgi:hypothetical protein